MTQLGTLRRRIFGIPSAKSVFRRPGFSLSAWDQFSPVAENLMEGYHATLETSDFADLQSRLEAIDPQFQGFAYEGAGMGLAALDAIGPWRDRVGEFLDGPARRHIYPFYVGVGLAYARMRSMPEAHLGRLDPLLGWVTADGYGFHEAFFHHRRTITDHIVPRGLSPYGATQFDQGVGRAIWFSSGANPERVLHEIRAFPEVRHSALWAGIGLASSYGGGADGTALEFVAQEGDAHRRHLSRGAAIAAWGRQLAGNSASHTELACNVYSGLDASTCAIAVATSMSRLPATARKSMHQLWHERIDAALRHHQTPATH